MERPNSGMTEKEAGNRDVESYTPWCRQDRGLNLIRSDTSTWLWHSVICFNALRVFV